MIQNKTIITVFFIALFSLIPASASTQERVITWATNPTYPPYDWKASTKEYEGACLDVLELVIPKGYTLRPIVVPWARAQKMAEEGRIDLLVNLRVTPERSAWLEFSQNPTFPNPIAVFMRRNKTIPLKSWEELRKHVGGTTVGDAFGNGFDEYLKENLTTESSATPFSNFRKLDSGRIDYFVTGYYMGSAMLHSAGMQDRITALRPFISDQPIHLGFSKRSPHLTLLPEIDRKLAQLAADGTLNRILNERFREAQQLPISVFTE